MRRVQFVSTWVFLLVAAVTTSTQGQEGGSKAPSPEELDPRDGVASVPDRAAFKKISFVGDMRRDSYLNDLEVVKFIVVKTGTKDAQIYFMNTKTHQAHPRFMGQIGLGGFRRGGPGGGRGGRGGPGGGAADGAPTIRGALTFRPLVRAPNGEPGLYTFDFQPSDAFPVKILKAAQDILIEKAPVLKGHLAYHPLQRSEERYEKDKAEFEKLGVPVYRDDDIARDLAFLPLNTAESFGRLRVLEPGDLASPSDIVLCESLPNEMPRVAGVLTSVRQTPLSHVNLRAIQDKIPNAYVRAAATNKNVQPLIGKFVFYKVAPDGFEIRAATKSEVETHLSKLRPKAEQIPKRNLAVESIKPLKEITFGDSAAFGVKTANLATLHSFGLPEGSVPQGFGVPFHFYDAFMKHNGLYAKAKTMLSQAEFQKDESKQRAALDAFRGLIEKGAVPAGMEKSFVKLHESFPKGTSLRCRSSTNNEDLPGFSGAGLYDSVTHRVDEGALSNSIKQVFASLWNYRAFVEREFYRIDHLSTAMGVLVHPNFDDELANGVAVTEDILYQTLSNYYVNTQVGEDLVTNPEARSVPEELLLGWWADDGYEVRQFSNRKKEGELILSKDHLATLRKCLTKIHGKFARLYKHDLDTPGFAMEVEFKITKDGKLLVKQARPWVFGD